MWEILVTLCLVETSDFRPTLLISGVALHRSDDPREAELTLRLLGSIIERAADRWNTVISWGEEDGPRKALHKLSTADALVIMGGPDLSPRFYNGQSRYENATEHFPRSDRAQLALIRRAVATHTPTLGICRGMQALNVAMSGTLTQDISQSPGHSSPDLMKDFEFARHTVSIAAGSRLANTLGSCTTVDPTSLDGGLRTMIHSAHHQAVSRLGSDLTVTATADDGTIEAIEHTSAPVVGVQWHPEDPDADQGALSCLLERMCSSCSHTLAA